MARENKSLLFDCNELYDLRKFEIMQGRDYGLRTEMVPVHNNPTACLSILDLEDAGLACLDREDDDRERIKWGCIRTAYVKRTREGEIN